MVRFFFLVFLLRKAFFSLLEYFTRAPLKDFASSEMTFDFLVSSVAPSFLKECLKFSLRKKLIKCFFT